MKSLSDALGTSDPRLADALARALPADEPVDPFAELTDFTGEQFSRAVLHSREFRQYILRGLVMGDLPPGVVTRLLDHGFGKVPEQHEHTGKDGKPIEVVTRVERVIVDVPAEKVAP